MNRKHEQAMVFLDTHGSTSYPPVMWRGYAFAEADYVPEWLESEVPQHVDGGCVTVLSCSEPRHEPGFRVHGSYGVGERECPWCGSGTGDEDKRSECKLCEGDGLIYWGEEWRVVVFVPTRAGARLRAASDRARESRCPQ